MDDKITKDLDEFKKCIVQGSIDSAARYLVRALKCKVDCYHQTKFADYQEEEDAEKLPKYLAHYTSLETIYSILESHRKHQSGYEYQQENDACLNLYSANSLNDPKEGKYLKEKLAQDRNIKWLNDTDKKIDAEKEKNAIEEETDAFVCSFVSGSDRIGDELRYWQSYGDNGLGCSIKIVRSYHKEFNHVRYGEEKVQDVKKYFKEYFEWGKQLCEKFSNDKREKQFVTEFWRAFDKIKFLYKHQDYQHEKEYRYITIIDSKELKDSKRKVRYHFKKEGPYLRRYILNENISAKNILGSGSKITIGPRVVDKERVCKILKEFADQVGLDASTFTPSKINYRKIW